MTRRDFDVPKRISRRRRSLATGAAAGLVVLAVPAGAALGLPGSSTPRPTPTNSAPGGPKWQSQQNPEARRAAGPGRAYIALAGGYTVSTVDVTDHAILADNIRTDAARGVVATPDGSKLYVANTGQYDVLVVDPLSGGQRPIHVGPYPQDVAISPDGGKVYATVTGGDSGRGGSDVVAVIDTRTGTVTRRIHVGTAPRQAVFSRDGARAYVTYDGGVAIIDARQDRVIRSIHDPGGTQGVAVDPGGRTLYVTNPIAGEVTVIDTASGKVKAKIHAGDQPWAVDVTPDGSKAYVAEMNDNVVAEIDTATRKVVRTIGVGTLPEAVAITPDGSEAWVGNGHSGSVSVISTVTGAVIATIVGGTGAEPLDAAPVGIAFAKAPDLLRSGRERPGSPGRS